MTAATTWTIGQLLKWTADYLRQHGADSPRLDAEVLLAHARGCNRIELYTSFDEVADEPVRTAFRQLVRRRAAGTPVAYLVGHREFYSRTFAVTTDVLIPRPETEFVLIALFDLIKAQDQNGRQLRLADIGTGSGILAMCAALELPAARVTATDISPAALEVARRNAQQHAVSDRIDFVQGDLFSGVDPALRFDFIVSNPPYIRLDERASLSRDVVDHEPHQALFAGAQGLDILAPLIAQAVDRLKPGGWLISEFSPPQATDLQQLIEEQEAFESPRFIDDLNRDPRVLTVRRRSTADRSDG